VTLYIQIIMRITLLFVLFSSTVTTSTFPPWPATYNLQRSTIAMPANQSGLLNLTLAGTCAQTLHTYMPTQRRARMQVRTPNTKHQTPNTTPNTKHQTPNTKHQTPNPTTKHQTPNTPPTPNTHHIFTTGFTACI